MGCNRLNSKFTSILIIVLINFNINLYKCEDLIDNNKNPVVFNNISETKLKATTIIPNDLLLVTTIDNNTLPVEESNFAAKNFDNLDENVTKKIVISSKPNGNTTDDENEDEIYSTKPKSCSEMKREKLPNQPINTINSLLKKCCPMGESLHPYDGPGGRKCDYENKTFVPKLITAALYENCIEDLEEHYELEVEVGNPCNVSFIYTRDYGDRIYVMQNGSLLIMDEYGNQSFDIFDDYCLDVDYQSGELLAIVCVTPIGAHISEAQTILFAVFMFVSVICLIFVAYIHFAIRELRTVHGLSLGCMSLCLAIGFSLYIYAQLIHGDRGRIGYFVQFFLLAYFFWLTMLALNIVVTVWYFLPRYITITRTIRYCRLGIYACIASFIPLFFVLITYSKRLPGMPSYFYQAWSESVQESQRYFIPPVSACIFSTFCLLVISYFGFRNCDKILLLRGKIEYRSITNGRCDGDMLPVMDEHFLEETKQDATCISILLGIISITWILEVITFYAPGSDDYMAFMEIMNGLQGFFILMIFIVGRKRRSVIIRWWHDRGSHEITPVPTREPKEAENGV
ncbi:probable G-protein coupled receptor Mth-like 14 [Condylostylus longicornis]|uniref:probable G-protein coupled receptor Mth-like 14 n=1 Tax=Condylostylus longicornis TaxID=2530218 RepID=UPI00244DFAC8|nr:probable G-protein coupled receptor Mth-like 14 [Condylostylus longicornis]